LSAGEERKVFSMKRILCVALFGVMAQGAMAADVGVSINIGDPHFYGRIDIGNFPRPVLMYPQPVVIQPGGGREPLYLRVPPGHAKNWRKHCARYNACGYPVYFVQDNWYRNVYAPRYRSGPDYHPAPPPRVERYEERREQRFDDRRDRREQRFDDRRDHREQRFDDRQDRREQRFEDRGDRGGRGGDRGERGGGHGHGNRD